MLTGYIEGYYGSLLDWNQRLKILESLSALNLNSYFYCPKEDPFHRLEWVEDYADEYLLNLGSFFESAKSLNIELIFGISPGFVSESIDQKILNNKIQAIFDLGIKSLCILFDDISFEATKQKGKEHAEILNKVVQDFPEIKLYIVPQIYSDQLSKTDVTDCLYLNELFSRMKYQVPFFWTGENVVSKNYDLEYISKIQERFNQDLIIWDNFYASDYCEPRVTIDAYNPFVKNPKNIYGVMINPTGKVNLDILLLELFSSGMGKGNENFKSILKKHLPNGMIDILHYFKFEGRIGDIDEDIKIIDKVLWNSSMEIKLELYPYLHFLRFVLKNKPDLKYLLDKRLRLKS
jgi:hypothetical protein